MKRIILSVFIVHCSLFFVTPVYGDTYNKPQPSNTYSATGDIQIGWLDLYGDDGIEDVYATGAYVSVSTSYSLGPRGYDVRVGDTVTLHAVEAPGYQFQEWEDAYGAKSYENPYIFVYDGFFKTYTAHTYELAKWDVSFNLNYFEALPSVDQRIANGSKATKPSSDPTRTGYTFGGWYTEIECNYAFDFNSLVYNDIHLYAKWILIPYTITFSLNYDGATGAPASKIVNFNEHIPKPGNPTRTGYTFGAWYKESACANIYDFDNNTVSDNITLYASWMIKSYNVSFNLNYTNATDEPAGQSVQYGNKATRPSDPARTGYTLDGWYKESGGANKWDFNDPVTGELPLYAKWTLNKYNITFNLNYIGAPAPVIQSFDHGSKIVIDITRTGYTLDGWYTDAACTTAYDLDSPVTFAATLYAKWSITKYNIAFNLNYTGATGAPTTQSVEHNNKVPRPGAPSRIGYTFGGWYKEAAGTNAYDFNAPVTASFTLHAKWTLNTYTVTFVNYTGELVAATQTINHGSKVIKPIDPSRYGYTFNGWYTDEAGTNAYNFDTSVTEPLILYAGWKPITYTVAFNLNYPDAPPSFNQGTEDNNRPINYGSKATQPNPDPLRTGYTFGGWFRQAVCTNAYDFNTPVTTPTTLYAKWIINKYTVAFNLNYPGAPAASTQSIDYNSKVPAPDPALTSADPNGINPSRIGYDFGGWYKQAACTNAYDFNTPITSDLTLYAKWTISAYTVTFKFNTGAPDYIIPHIEYLTLLTLFTPPLPTREGYFFDKWVSAAGEPYDFNAKVTSDLTLYAKWSSLSATSLDAVDDAAAYGDAVYYDLQGRRVSHPVIGRLYLIIYGNGARRLIIKQ